MMLPTPGAGNMEFRSNQGLWNLFACSTVLVLLLSSVAQRQFQTFHASVRSAKEAGEDFPIYYSAGKIARQHGDRTLYYPAANGERLTVRNLLDPVPPNTTWSRVAEASGFHNTGRFMAPPFMALLDEPLALMRPATALLTWRLATTLMLTLAIYLSIILFDSRHSYGLFVTAVAAAFSFFPFVETLFQGQVDALVLLLWVLGVYFVKTRTSIASAFCFALATMIKLSPALAVGIFLLRRQWRWLIAYSLWMGIFLAIGVWQLGWNNHVFWFSRVLPMLSGGVPYFASKSLPSFIADLYLRQVPLDVQNLPALPLGIALLSKLVSLALYLGTLFYFWKKSNSARYLTHELALIPLVILLISPESFRHHYLQAVFPLLYLWIRSRDWTADSPLFRWSALALSSLIIGTVFADYLITAVRNPGLDLLLASLFPAATISLIYVASTTPPPDTELATQEPQLVYQPAA